MKYSSISRWLVPFTLVFFAFTACDKDDQFSAPASDSTGTVTFYTSTDDGDANGEISVGLDDHTVGSITAKSIAAPTCGARNVTGVILTYSLEAGNHSYYAFDLERSFHQDDEFTLEPGECLLIEVIR